MWLARNKNGELRLFEIPPKRFHEGPALKSEFVGFNTAVSVGDDDYSFWAEQTYFESNKIPDKKCYGIRLMTEGIKDGCKVLFDYEPNCAKNLTWEDIPMEIEIIPKNYVKQV